MSNPVPPPNVTITTKAPRVKVKTIGGSELELLHKREKDFYEEARDKYQAENVFTVASDLRALDRLLFYETQMFRWQWYLMSGVDYDLMDIEPAEEIALRRSIKDTAPLISQLQNDLGLTKMQRDKDKIDSVGAYITTLKRAAKEHGVRREKQLGKAIELTNELFAIAGAYKRSSQHEREKLGFETAEDVVDWILEFMRPEFDEVDKYFRAHQQRFFLREL